MATKLRGPMRRLVREAESRGWTVTLTSGNHIRFVRAGAIVIASGVSRPSDRRSMLNTIATIRRAERREGDGNA